MCDYEYTVPLSPTAGGPLGATIDLSALPPELLGRFQVWTVGLYLDPVGREPYEAQEVIHVVHTDDASAVQPDSFDTQIRLPEPTEDWTELGKVTFLGSPAEMAAVLRAALTSATDERVTYYHWDHLGTSRVATDHTGDVIARTDYWPYGVEMFRDELDAPENTHQFTGHERDLATGLDYMRARYYRDTLGRFLSPDPIRHRSGSRSAAWNRYAYALANPLIALDPDGREVTVHEYLRDAFIHAYVRS